MESKRTPLSLKPDTYQEFTDYVDRLADKLCVSYDQAWRRAEVELYDGDIKFPQNPPTLNEAA